MIMVIAPTLVPREQFGKYIAIISSVFAIASVLGPILGGAINTRTTWAVGLSAKVSLIIEKPFFSVGIKY